MNIENIRKIVCSSLDEKSMRYYLIAEIARDKNAILDVMDMLNSERENNKELILDMNLELSRADVHLRDKKLLKINQKFIEGEIDKFYNKYDGIIGHCFRNIKTENK